MPGIREPRVRRVFRMQRVNVKIVQNVVDLNVIVAIARVVIVA